MDADLKYISVLLFVYSHYLAFCQATVTMRIELIRFDNHGRKAYDKGIYCGGHGNCNTYFKLCVKPSTSQPSSLSNCWYFKESKSQNLNSFDFKSVSTGIPRVIEIQKSLWPGNIGFYMEVWDEDFLTTPDFLDVHKYRKIIAAGVNGSSLTYHNEGSTGERPHKPASNLTFRIQVSCDRNYYGVACGKFCEDSNDSINGHYRCDTNGAKVCLNGWYKLPSCLQYCVPQNSDTKGHYTCSSIGTRICLKNWFGKFCNVSINRNSDIKFWKTMVSNPKTHLSKLPATSISTIGMSPSYRSGIAKSVISSSFSKSSALTSKSVALSTKSVALSLIPVAPTSRISSPPNPAGTMNLKSRKSAAYSTPLLNEIQTMASIKDSSLIKDKTMTIKRHQTKAVFSTIYNQVTRHDKNTILLQSSFFTASVTGQESLKITPSFFHANSDTNFHTLSSVSSAMSSSGPLRSSTMSMKTNSCATAIPKNREGDVADFKWMLNTTKGNLALIGFTLAFVFFVLLVFAVAKIYRLKRFMNQPRPLHNEVAPRDNGGIRVHHRGEDRKKDKFQMCSRSCFGAVRGELNAQTQYAYQKQETGM